LIQGKVWRIKTGKCVDNWNREKCGKLEKGNLRRIISLIFTDLEIHGKESK